MDKIILGGRGRKGKDRWKYRRVYMKVTKIENVLSECAVKKNELSTKQRDVTEPKVPSHSLNVSW